MIECEALSCSLVIPFFNEVESVTSVLSEACAAMQALGRSHEVIAVDDGSSDRTRLHIQGLMMHWPSLRVIAFDRNRGQAAALLDGLRAARGKVLITMDGDGQNDPQDIAMMLAELESVRADMVTGVRVKRRDSWLRRSMSRLANKVRQRLLKDGVTDSGCALKVFRREVSAGFIPIRTLYSFMPALAVAAGFRVKEVLVNHRTRETGVSKYGLGVMFWRPVLDMLGVWWFIRRRYEEIRPAIIS